MIEQFTRSLPYKLAGQLTSEYNNRLSDIRYLVSGRFDFYSPLQSDLESISLILALSIFYKRIISNFDAATKFTNRVLKYSNAVSVQLGTYELTSFERNKMTRVILQYHELLAKYSIELNLFDYLETKEFLRKVKAFKSRLNEKNG